MGVSVVEEEKALWGRRKNTAFFAILHSLINHHQHRSFSESEKHSYGSVDTTLIGHIKLHVDTSLKILVLLFIIKFKIIKITLRLSHLWS